MRVCASACVCIDTLVALLKESCDEKKENREEKLSLLLQFHNNPNQPKKKENYFELLLVVRFRFVANEKQKANVLNSVLDPMHATNTRKNTRAKTAHCRTFHAQKFVGAFGSNDLCTILIGQSKKATTRPC